MKRVISLALALTLMVFMSTLVTNSAKAQSISNQYGKKAIDKTGVFDDDGDGIPNCQDPDYVKPKDGTGKQLGKLNRSTQSVNGQAKGYGAGNGNGNKGIGPKDGTGYGSGTGVCDGTGPKGKGRKP